MELPIDSKPADQDRGEHRVSWQPLGFIDRQISEGKAGCRKGVVGGDSIAFRFNRHEAIGETAAHILGHVLEKIAIERLHATFKSVTVMSRAECFETEACSHLLPNSF